MPTLPSRFPSPLIHPLLLFPAKGYIQTLIKTKVPRQATVTNSTLRRSALLYPDIITLARKRKVRLVLLLLLLPLLLSWRRSNSVELRSHVYQLREKCPSNRKRIQGNSRAFSVASMRLITGSATHLLSPSAPKEGSTGCDWQNKREQRKSCWYTASALNQGNCVFCRSPSTHAHTHPHTHTLRRGRAGGLAYWRIRLHLHPCHVLSVLKS